MTRKTYEKIVPVLVLIIGAVSLVIIWQQSRRAVQIAPGELPFSKSTFERYLGTTAAEYFEGTTALALCQAIQDDDQIAFEQQLTTDSVIEKGVGGMTPLMWAFACGRLGMFETLLQHGASPNARLEATLTIRRMVLEKGNTLLLLSLKNRQFDFFHKALEFATDATQADPQGWTLLHYHIASVGGDGSAPANPYVIQIIDQLLERDADINAQSNSGITPLHVAVGKQPAYCIPLFERGADPTLENAEGESPLDLLLLAEPPRLAPHMKRAVDWLREKDSGTMFRLRLSPANSVPPSP